MAAALSHLTLRLSSRWHAPTNAYSQREAPRAHSWKGANTRPGQPPRPPAAQRRNEPLGEGPSGVLSALKKKKKQPAALPTVRDPPPAEGQPMGQPNKQPTSQPTNQPASQRGRSSRPAAAALRLPGRAARVQPGSPRGRKKPRCPLSSRQLPWGKWGLRGAQSSPAGRASERAASGRGERRSARAERGAARRLTRAGGRRRRLRPPSGSDAQPAALASLLRARWAPERRVKCYAEKGGWGGAGRGRCWRVVRSGGKAGAYRARHGNAAERFKKVGAFQVVANYCLFELRLPR